MNPDNGHIYKIETEEERKQLEDMQDNCRKLFAKLPTVTLDEAANRGFIEMKDPPTEKQMSRDPAKVGRNEPCPCGSGKKFKNCHMIPKG